MKHSHYIKWGLGIIALLFVTGENAILTIDNLNHNVAIVGLKLNGASVSFQDKARLEETITTQLSHHGEALTLQYSDTKLHISPATFAGTVNAPAFADQLLKVGRTGAWRDRLSAQHNALLGFIDFKIKANPSSPALVSLIKEVKTQINKDPSLPSLDFIHNLELIPPEPGVAVDEIKLAALIRDHIFNPPNQPLPLPVVSVPPTHTVDELSQIRSDVPAYLKDPIRIESHRQVFTLTPDDLRALLTVAARPDPQNPSTMKLVLRLDETKLNQKLGDFAAQVEATTNAEFNDHDARAAIFAQFYAPSKRKITSVPTGESPLLATTPASAPPSAPQSKKFVYLTFDDGPNSIYHPEILNILKKFGIKATFFLVGNNAKLYDKMTERTVAEGHTIGNHSLTHAFLPRLSSQDIFKEISYTDDILKPFVNNNDLHLFRPPYGGVSPQVKRYAKDLNLKLILWSVDPRDWSEPGTDELVRRVLSHATNGSDILLHSNHLSTVKALPRIIEGLKAKGYGFAVLN